VRAWLVAHGIPAARLSAQGYGDTQPVKPNTDEIGRALNRRVELRDPSCTAP
jgi:outer membrane protein OmpA-like peptidoglycan-associated protein